MSSSAQAIAVSISIILLSGCGHGARERWLEILFDEAPRARAETTVEARETRADSSVGPGGIPSAVATLHAPYAVGACGVCHNLKDSHSFPGGGGWPRREPSAERAATSRDPEAAKSSRLRLPPDRLCGACHDDLDALALAEPKVSLLGPVAMGDCLVCHDPHKSDERYLLRKSPVSDLCHACHNPAETKRLHLSGYGSQHACTACHSPHAADLPRLLLEERP